MLESARGPAPSFASAVAGDEVRGNCWGHLQAPAIYAATRVVRNSEDVLVCRLVGGKVTYVHRAFWPALARVAAHFDLGRLAWIHEAHTPSGAHVIELIPFPDWLPTEVAARAQAMTDAIAKQQLTAKVPELLRTTDYS